MLDRGFLRIGSWRGAPIRIHWTTPLGALLFSRGAFAPGFWLGFILLVLIHELGHAVLVIRRGLPLVGIDAHGFGGLCRFGGAPTQLDVAIIAWGGVLAQAALLLVTLLAQALLPPLHDRFWAEMAHVFVSTNLYLIALNLLPVAPLDGAEAWSIFRLLRTRRPGPGTPPQDLDREVKRVLDKARDDARRQNLH